MSNSPDNNPNGDGSQDPLKLLGQLVYSLLNSPKILSLLLTWPIVGNAILLLLTAGAGLPLVQDKFFTEDTVEEIGISASQLCEDIRTEHVLKQLKNEVRYEGNKISIGDEIDSQNIKLKSSSAPPEYIKDSVENSLFHCSYSLEVEGKTPQSYDFNVVFQPIKDEPFLPVEEEEITQEKMQRVCESPEYKEELLYTDDRFDQETEEVKEVEALLVPPRKVSVYSVYQWRCVYEIEDIKSDAVIKPIADKELISIGLRLDEFYCMKEFPEEGRNLTKASYHYYNDPYSWYCTNPNYQSQ